MRHRSMTPREIITAIARREDWYRIVDKGPTVPAEVYLYDEIGYWGTTAKDFTEELASVSSDLINVYVSSVGGEVFDGIAIYNAMRAHPAEIAVRVDSLAASIASVIVQAGDTRTMLTGSQMMIHNAATIAIGDSDAMREAADLLDKQNDVIAGIYAERSGRDAADFLELMDAETWMNADATVEAGLADVVVQPERKTTSAKSAESDTDATNMWDAFIGSTHIEG